jgi:hypothetical protein
MPRPSVTNALALRRLVVAAGALGASVVAHCAAAGDLALTPRAPVAWAGLLAVVTLVGPRRRFRPRGFAGSLAAMAVAQAAVHVAMTWAPWAFGLAPHHHDAALIGPRALVAHALAALALAALAAWLEGWLARAVAVLRAVRRWLGGRAVAARLAEGLAWSRALVSGQVARGCLSCRGPPLALSA